MSQQEGPGVAKMISKGHGSEGLEEHGLMLAAMGLEAEFLVEVDGQATTPEVLFGEPKEIVRGHKRTGKSVQMPTGCALYFDTGVVELATPVVEISAQSGAQAGRVLWESIDFLRQELDRWEAKNKRNLRLQGFSTHYNISFTTEAGERRQKRTVAALAYLLTHILPWPVMIVAANNESTGIGARPRGQRIEITADFTPDPALMIAAAGLITGVVREVITWRSFDIQELNKRGIPVVDGFKPIKHSSRQGWVAKDKCFVPSPFNSKADECLWPVQGHKQSTRQLAVAMWHYFQKSIEKNADEKSLNIIKSILCGQRTALMEQGKPDGYMDVGRKCGWNNLYSKQELPRSVYEQLVHDALAKRKLLINGELFQAVGLKGWSRIRLKRIRDGARFLASLDYLRNHSQSLG